ncbi:hypothetical protein F2981_31040 (plasmid) [Sinorhizobium meliloti]|nr:hypothetical protein [Sinorhizobium meliloti]
MSEMWVIDDPQPRAQLYPLLPVGVKGGWNVADCVARSYDIEGMDIGTVGAGRDRHRGAAPAQTVRCQAALHRPAPASGRGSRRSSALLSIRRAEMVPVCDV